jgi:hypothetical protein
VAEQLITLVMILDFFLLESSSSGAGFEALSSFLNEYSCHGT